MGFLRVECWLSLQSTFMFLRTARLAADIKSRGSTPSLNRKHRIRLCWTSQVKRISESKAWPTIRWQICRAWFNFALLWRIRSTPWKFLRWPKNLWRNSQIFLASMTTQFYQTKNSEAPSRRWKEARRWKRKRRNRKWCHYPHSQLPSLWLTWISCWTLTQRITGHLWKKKQKNKNSPRLSKNSGTWTKISDNPCF